MPNEFIEKVENIEIVICEYLDLAQNSSKLTKMICLYYRVRPSQKR